MASTLVTVTFDPANGLADDKVVNTFAFNHASALDSVLANALFGALDGFYNDVQPTAGIRMSSFLSDNLSRNANAVAMKAYDITGLEGINPATGKVYAHGSPKFETVSTLGAAVAAANPLPSQVAIVLTLRAFGWEDQPVEQADGSDPGSAVDRPRARYSGRIFLGPWNTGVLAELSNEARPQTTTVNLIGECAQRMTAEAQTAGANWAVWSRRDGDLRNISDVQVDNAFDIQRRRQARPTSRTTFVV